MHDSDAILSARALTVGFREGKRWITVLADLDLELHAGRMTALLGRNGAGKSTLLRALTLSTRPIAGEITINGRPASDIGRRELSRLIALVATTRQVMGQLTVAELVALGRQPHTGLLGRLSADDKRIVAEAMEATGISHKANTDAMLLSDGERQKVMIARALAQQTPIIILDEPTAFLDVASRIETMRLLHSLARDHNKAVLLSSHDISQSLLLADDLWLITADGEMVTGTTEHLQAGGQMERLFQNTSLCFNNDICDYEAVLPATAQVRLDCPPELRHIVANALLRNGVAVSANARHTVACSAIDRYRLDDAPAEYSLSDVIKRIETGV